MAANRVVEAIGRVVTWFHEHPFEVVAIACWALAVLAFSCLMVG